MAEKEVVEPSKLDFIILELEIAVNKLVIEYKCALTRERMLEIIAREVEVNRILH